MVDKLNQYTLTRPRLKKIIGWFLVVIGFVALIVPIIPGAPIVFVGLEVLGLRFIFTDKIKSFFKGLRSKNVEATVLARVTEKV